MQLLAVLFDPDVVRFKVSMGDTLLFQILNNLEKVFAKARQKFERQAPHNFQFAREGVAARLIVGSRFLLTIPFTGILHQESEVAFRKLKEVFGTNDELVAEFG